jgi:hypothetical protein
VGVKLVAENYPGSLQVGIDHPYYMGDKVGFGPPILDGRGEQFPRGPMQVGRKPLRAMSDVVEFPPLAASPG